MVEESARESVGLGRDWSKRDVQGRWSSCVQKGLMDFSTHLNCGVT